MSGRPFLLLLVMMHPAVARDFPSLFFSDEEMALPQETRIPLVLSGILYSDPAHWTVWINGAPFCPDTLHEDFDIEAVTPTTVTISYRNSMPTIETLVLQMEDGNR